VGTFFRAFQRRGRRGRVEQQLDKALLVLGREAEDMSLLDRLLRSANQYVLPSHRILH
jgi:hypothetical protein